LSVLVFLAGLFWTVHTLAATPGRLLQIYRKAGLITELRARQAGLTTAENAVAAFEQIAGKRPANLRELAKATLPGIAADIRPRETRSAVTGWSVRSADVLFGDIPLARLAAFLRAAEAQRPPWRLVECQIAAADRGTGRVSLVLEALEKAGSNP
jgi:hypothetical protein